MNNDAIGVFDSGIGGMTVVRELLRELPGERIIYYGDTARVPYGGKSKATILGYARQITGFLESQGVKAIVVACNTVSAVALEELKSEFSVPIIGVVKPGAKAAAESTRSGRIGVIATRATIGSGIYENFLHETNPGVQVFTKACPLFVPLVEEGWIDDPITDMVIHRYIDELLGKGIDSLVLGCTHYPLLMERIGAAAGEGVTLVNPAYETAKAFRSLLEEKGLLRTDPSKPDHRFYVSDSPEHFRSFANTILGGGNISQDAVAVRTFE